MISTLQRSIFAKQTGITIGQERNYIRPNDYAKKNKNIALPSSPYFFFYDFSPLLFYSSNFMHYMTPTGRSRVLLLTSAWIELNFIKIKHTFKISGKTRRVTVTQDFFCYALNLILITTDQSERFYFIYNFPNCCPKSYIFFKIESLSPPPQFPTNENALQLL